METVIGISIFILTVLMVEEGYFVVKAIWKPDLKQMQRRLRTFSTAQYTSEGIDIVKKTSLSEVPWLNRLLLHIRGVNRIERFLEQADAPYPLGFYLLLSLVFSAAGLYLVSFFTPNIIIRTATALVLLMVPAMYVRIKRKRRMAKFERQLPEALDMVSRSLKAGHAFTGGLKAVVDEFDDPIGPEFDKTLNEINFGVGVPEALKNLAHRVACEDLSFFVVSVIIQRDTGGNLAEILEGLSHLIRERFKFQGKLKTLSSEGKFSAGVLILIPFVIVAALSVINPQYITVLTEDPIGKLLIGVSITGMIVGIFVMMRMIDIRV